MSLLDRIKSMFSSEPPAPGDERHPGAQPTSADALERTPTAEEAAAAAAAQPQTAHVEPASAEPPSADVARSAEDLDETAGDDPGPWTAPEDESGERQV